MIDRRQFLKGAAASGALLYVSGVGWVPRALAAPATTGLGDPALQPKFVEIAPNALDPGFLFKDLNEWGGPARRPDVSVRVAATRQEIGLVDPRSGRRLKTDLWGYGSDTVSWPGQTFQVMSTSAGGAE